MTTEDMHIWLYMAVYVHVLYIMNTYNVYDEYIAHIQPYTAMS